MTAETKKLAVDGDEQFGLADLLQRSHGLGVLYRHALYRVEHGIMRGPLDVSVGGDLAVRLTPRGWYLFSWGFSALDDADAFGDPQQHAPISEALAVELIRNNLTSLALGEESHEAWQGARDLVAAMHERLAAQQALVASSWVQGQ